MIDKKCLQFNVYEYLNYCHTCGDIRGVAVITDKQYVFYSQILDKDYKTHDDIVIDIEKTIHPDSKRNGFDAFRQNNAYIFAIGSRDFGISLPDNGELSLSQLNFIFDILDQVDRYNKEEENNRKVTINLSIPGDYFYDYKNSDVIKIKQKLKEMVTKKITIEKEIIIGKTLTKEKIKENLSFHIGIDNCTSIKEVVDNISSSLKYCNDNYYQEIFSEILPDYLKVFSIASVLNKIDIDNKEVENVKFDNVFDILSKHIKCIFKNKKLNEVVEINHSISSEMKDDMIEEFFPNFQLFSIFVKYIFTFNKQEKTYIDELFSNASNYEELSKIVFILGYNKKIKDLENGDYNIGAIPKSNSHPH